MRAWTGARSVVRSLGCCLAFATAACAPSLAQPDVGVVVDGAEGRDAGVGEAADAASGGEAADAAGGASPGQDVGLDSAASGGGAGVCRAFCASGTEAPGALTAPRLETLVQDVADATCEAIFRCCDGVDRTVLMAAIRNDALDEWPLAGLRPRLPPDDRDFTLTECRAVLGEAYAVLPFGSWMAEVEAGRVRFDAEAYAGCLATLEGASCGTEMAAALTDGTCLGFAPPTGGELQRRMFPRHAGPGEPCRRIDDGVGAGLYGSCDPSRAFCCHSRPDVGSECWLPRTPDSVGTCRAIAPVGERCAFTPASYRLCATGSDCGGDGTCEAPATSLPLVAQGETCFADLSFVADCGPDASCDVLGTGTCVPLRELGERCDEPGVCRSGRCG